jgi:ferric enterobactin receptor
MRLVIRVKYILRKRYGCKLFNTIVFLFLFASLSGQAYKMTFSRISLSGALLEASGVYGFKVAFDSDKLGSTSFSGEVTGSSVDEFLTNLLNNTGFGFKFLHDSYLIIPKDETSITAVNEKCQIVGSVTDVENGESLPFASVLLADPRLLSSATGSGSFFFKDVRANPVHLTISYIGYVPFDTSMIWSDPVISLKVKMKKMVTILDTIYIKGRSVDMVNLRNDVDFATTVDPAKLSDLPVLAETDIFRSLQLLPGISYSENSTGINIRGGSCDQNLILFDGQTLYNLSHFYGVISSINPNVVKDLQIYKGGYDSRFGERVSGIIDITGKSGNQLKPTLYGDINLLDANLTAEVPLSRKLTLIAAGRRSYSDLYATSFSDKLFSRNLSSMNGDTSSIVNQTKPSFRFYDYNMKLTYRLSDLESLSLSVYGGKDHFLNSYGQNSKHFDIFSTDENIWSNLGISATWSRQWNSSFYSSLQAGTSGYSNSYSNTTSIDHPKPGQNYGKFLPDTFNMFDSYSRNKLSDFYLTMKNDLRLSETSELNFGFTARVNDIYYHKDADSIYVYDNLNQSALTTLMYVQDRIRISDRFMLKPGIRANFYSGQNRLVFEPRLSANYILSEVFSVRMATGRYYQFINQVLAQQETGYNKNFWVLADESLHPAVSSWHLIAGLTAEKGNFLLDAEGYIKTFSGVQEYLYVSQYLRNSDFSLYFPKPGGGPAMDNQPSVFVTGTGRAFGADFLLKYKCRVYTTWFSFSYGRSYRKFKEINNNQTIPSPADQPYQVSWTNMFTTGRWNFGVVSLFSSGKPYIVTYKGTSGLPVERIYARLSDYYRTDVSVNCNFTLLKIRLKTGATIYNIFNTQNYFDVNNRKFDFDNLNFTETTLVKSQSISLNLFLHFIF